MMKRGYLEWPFLKGRPCTNAVCSSLWRSETRSQFLNRIAHPLELHGTFYGLITDSVMVRIVAKEISAAHASTSREQKSEENTPPPTPRREPLRTDPESASHSPLD
jgi:hypothetical protein|uniref:Uncharacterized protein n=1 Tax=Pseudomonas aeruginosa TaxID=287 RepID=A0A1V0M638_PSEAI|nr:Hypothetical protein [Pseudomonas aeruginosa]QOJ62925.1 Hypothetical protein [Pseudomonas aeruginosa]QOJ63478.1 Hypothetical protein [Pseudomonas aeruginosa]QOJ64032.1 Hypothetical protein [Pseudomonas aeruginosa]QOJ64546.1 Hypothetical protein [Pseudomonas aeruginosa]